MQEIANQYANALVAYYIEARIEADAKASDSVNLTTYVMRTRNAYNKMVTLQNGLAMVAQQEAEKFA